MQDSPLVAIVGPTGSGKSDLSLRICKEFGGEVVNCDSVQLYRFFNIGSAKLRPADRQGIPHHMLDILDPDEFCTAGEFASRARPILRHIAKSGLPVVAGGTGFYLRALLDGLFQAPTRDIALRDKLAGREKRRPGSLHTLLRRFDPSGAAAIHPNDTPKLIRALEVFLLTRRPISEWFSEPRDRLTGFRVLKIGLDPPREELYRRLDARSERMFASGLLEEVQSILASGWPASSKPFESVGYKQALQILSGALTLDEGMADTRIDTRHYAKRQMTWFRKEPGIHWFSGFGDDAKLQNAVAGLVDAHVNSTRNPIELL